MEKTERDLNQRLQEESRLVVALRHEVKEQEELLNNIEELQAENSRLSAENRRIKVSKKDTLARDQGAGGAAQQHLGAPG
jgi:hypothetical protein